MPTYAELQDAMTMLSGFCIAIGVILAMLPVGTCSECVHCRRQRTKATPNEFCKLHSRPLSECRGMHDGQ